MEILILVAVAALAIWAAWWGARVHASLGVLASGVRDCEASLLTIQLHVAYLRSEEERRAAEHDTASLAVFEAEAATPRECFDEGLSVDEAVAKRTAIRAGSEALSKAVLLAQTRFRKS